MTNAEKLAKDPEKLSKVIGLTCMYCPAGGGDIGKCLSDKPCDEVWLKWLESEAEEDE